MTQEENKMVLFHINALGRQHADCPAKRHQVANYS